MRDRPRGFIVVEVLSGLLLIVAVASLLLVAMSRQQQVATRLAAERAAARRADAALLDLADGTATTRPADVTTRVLPDAAPAGWRWMEVTALAEGRPISITGLAAVRTEAR